jgi:hypothetical protein
MNSVTARRLSDRIGPALRRRADEVEQCQAGKWSCVLANGAALRSTVWIDPDDGWLCMDAALSKDSPQWRSLLANRLWDILTYNAALPGGAKYALDSAGCLRVRSELPLDSEADVPDVTAEMCEGFEQALNHLRHEGGPEPGTGRQAGDRANMVGHGDSLECLREELAWPTTERPDGRLAVTLDVPGSFCQALVRPQADKVRVAVELVSEQSLSPVSRRALGLLLLSANSAVRMARAAAEDRNGLAAAWFEVVLTSRAAVAEAEHALAALSVACRLCVREVKAMQDDAIAMEYLSVRGWACIHDKQGCA